MKQIGLSVLLAFPIIFPAYASEDLQEEVVLQKAAEKAQKNDEIAKNYGFKMETTIQKLEGDNDVDEEIQRKSHIVWLEGKPYNEILQINGKDLNSKQKAEEAKRRKEFIKSIREKKKTIRESLQWSDVFQKYDFSFLPPEGGIRYLISFKPKAGKLPERNIYEKVFNHLSGKAYVDEQFNLVKAEAWLVESIRFGFGIFGKIEGIHFTYTQKEFESVWLPNSFHLKYKARRFLFRDNQDITTRFYDFYPRPDEPSQNQTGSNRP